VIRIGFEPMALILEG